MDPDQADFMGQSSQGQGLSLKGTRGNPRGPKKPSAAWRSESTASCILIIMRKLFLSTGILSIFSSSFSGMAE